MLPGVLIILVFLVLAGLMMSRKMPALLALPVMAVAIGVIAGVASGLPWSVAAPPEGAKALPNLRDLLFDVILTQGAGKLALQMTYAIFGSILSQVVMRQGIAQRIVRVAAELAGDNKLVLAIVMTTAIALSFLSLTGLGAVIMVGSLALPILIGAGLSPQFAGCLMLFGISIGGCVNPVNLGFYQSVLKVPLVTVKTFSVVYAVLLAVAMLAFVAWFGRAESRRHAWAMDLGELASPKVPLPALLTPVIPIVLIILPWTLWPIIPAFLVGIMFGLITTEPTRIIPNGTAAFLEGLKDIAPVLGLFMGIGMVLNAMTDPTTNGIMAPFITSIVPTSTVGYIAFFTLLAPLGLYRGPLNLLGLGAGFAALVLANNLLPGAAIMAAFMAVGQVQGVCDPTNTANVWIAQFTHGSTEDFLKRTLPFVWVFVLVALIYAVFFGRVMQP